MEMGKSKIVDANKPYCSRHFFSMNEHNQNDMVNFCRKIAGGKPYFVVGGVTKVLGLKMFEYRVDVYDNYMMLLIGVLKYENVLPEARSFVFQDIIN